MKKPLLIAATLVLMVVFFTGCGAAGVEGGSKSAEEAAKTELPPLTEADVDAMSDEEVIQMLNCQTQQVINDKGEKAGMDHVGDLWDKGVQEDGATVQVALSEEGYNCDELR